MARFNTTMLSAALTMTALVAQTAGCDYGAEMDEAARLATVEGAATYVPTPSDPWRGLDGELVVPKYVKLPHVALPVVGMCAPPAPLTVQTTAADTTSGSFEEVAVPKDAWPELRRLPGQDIKWDETGTELSVEEMGDGQCRWKMVSGKTSWERRAWVWAGRYEIYNRNVNLETWYEVVGAWGEAGKDLAKDYAMTGAWQDLGVMTDVEGLVIDGAAKLDGVLNPTGEEDPVALEILDGVDKAVAIGEVCSEGFKTLKVSDHLKAAKLGVMTWGLTIDAVTHLQRRLGLLPESEWYEGERDVLFGISFDEPEGIWTGTISYGEPFQCDAAKKPSYMSAVKAAGGTEPVGAEK